MASGRGFHPLAGQQQHAGFDLLEKEEVARRPCASGAAYAPACPTCFHPHSAPPLAEPPVWRRLHCDCPHGIGSTLRYGRLPTRPIAGYVPNAHGASEYGATTASEANRRASEPLMRP